MTIPPAFRDEPYRSLAIGGPVLVHQAPAILGLSLSQFRELQEVGLLPFPTCDAGDGVYSFNRKKLVAIRWSIETQNNWFTDAVSFWLNRKRDL